MPTKVIRVYEPTARKLAAIAQASAEGEDVADVLERLVNPAIDRELDHAIQHLQQLKSHKPMDAKRKL